MKLMGTDLDPAKLMAFVGERLQERGLSSSPPLGAKLSAEGTEPRVDPLTFNLQALEANADATQGLPLETHRDGLAGRAVVLAKKLFRRAGQIFINEALGRQRVFNGHVRDSYAQLSAELVRLRQRVMELESAGRQLATSRSVASELVPSRGKETPVAAEQPRKQEVKAEPPAASQQPVARLLRLAQSQKRAPTKLKAQRSALATEPPVPPSAPRPPRAGTRRGR